MLTDMAGRNIEKDVYVDYRHHFCQVLNVTDQIVLFKDLRDICHTCTAISCAEAHENMFVLPSP